MNSLPYTTKSKIDGTKSHDNTSHIPHFLGGNECWKSIVYYIQNVKITTFESTAGMAFRFGGVAMDTCAAGWLDLTGELEHITSHV
jgi:hypothetical protein